MKVIIIVLTLLSLIFYFNISESELNARKEKRLKDIWNYNNIHKERYLYTHRHNKKIRITNSIWITDADWYDPMKQDSINKLFGGESRSEVYNYNSLKN